MDVRPWGWWRGPDHGLPAGRQEAAADLAAHLRDFIDLRDITLELASHLVGLLIGFEDTDWGKELLMEIAWYEAQGGDEPGPPPTAESLAPAMKRALPLVDAIASGDVT